MIKIHQSIEKEYYESSLSLILNNYENIKKELDNVPKKYYFAFAQMKDVAQYDLGWTFYPIIYKKRILDFDRFTNFTASLLQDIGVVNAGFSLFTPKTVTTVHCGNTPYTYRSHFGLKVPKECSFLVEDEDFTPHNNHITLFPSELPHIASNNSDEDRYILLIDFLKPNVTIDKLFNNKSDTNIKIIEK